MRGVVEKDQRQDVMCERGKILIKIRAYERHVTHSVGLSSNPS